MTDYNDVPLIGTHQWHWYIAYAMFIPGVILQAFFDWPYLAVFSMGVLLTVFAGHLRATQRYYWWAK